MKINNQYKDVFFSDIAVGEIFECGNLIFNFFIKTPVNGNVNAISLSDGSLHCFAGDEKGSRVDTAPTLHKIYT